MTQLFRVIARTTGSVQPAGQGTTWYYEVIYCGSDRDDARTAYHQSQPEDYGGSYGNRARETVSEVIDDADTDDFADDTVSADSAED